MIGEFVAGSFNAVFGAGPLIAGTLIRLFRNEVHIFLVAFMIQIYA